MTTADTMTHHLPDETLAAFADGRLRGRSRDEVIGHLAACDECRSIADMVADAQQEGVIETERPNVVQGEFGRWAAWAALAAAAGVAAVLLVSPAWEWIQFKRTAGVSELKAAAEAVGERKWEARMDGFAYVPYKVNRGGGGRDSRLTLEVAVSRVINQPDESPKALRAKGLAHLLYSYTEHGAPDERGRAAAEQRDLAIAELTKAAEKTGHKDARILNDLAAAYLARGHESDAEAALAAANQSLLIEETPEATWNKALALEAAGKTDEAIATWKKYLELDPDSPWAAEAAEKLSLLQ